MPDPCSLCGVRADVGCKHHPAEGSAPVQMEEKPDPRKTRQLQGYVFHRFKPINSLFGKAGNPTRAEFERRRRK